MEPAQPDYQGLRWPSLLARDGDELFDHYRHTLEKLGAEKGTIGLILGKAQNKFQDPAKLRRLVVDLIDCENWSAMGADVKGDAYEGLLEKNAQDTKSGAGQYFTLYDLRTNQHFTLKTNPLKREHLEEFVKRPTATTCRRPMSSRKKSWTTWRRRWSSSG